jgi:hypothetical protein
MVPFTAATRFNDIGREFVGAAMEFGEFFVIGDDLAVSL